MTKVNSRLEYFTSADKSQVFITPELRALFSKFSDPLTLNFKLMINYDKPYGLFAPETITNSALGYLKRIGELERYEMLKKWIDVFQDFVKSYDFLFLQCDGLEIVSNATPPHAFGPDDKIQFTIRETADMRLQSILLNWRHIWFDDIRCVEVLPANLRRFDANILVYSGGYYNMMLYDVLENNGLTSDNIETKIFPTIKKLSEDFFQDNGDYDFNHSIIHLYDASINHEDSGKTFFESLSNEPGVDFVKQQLVFNFRFGSYSGKHNNIFGEFNFGKLLGLVSAQNKISNEISYELSKQANQLEQQKNVSSKFGALFPTQETSKNNKLGNITNFSVNQKLQKYKNSIIQPNTVIGNALANATNKGYAKQLFKNSVDFGIQSLEDKFITGNIAKLNNAIFSNFNNTLQGMYETYIKPKNEVNKIKVENPIPEAGKVLDKVKNLKYEQTIYGRKTL